MQSKVALGSHNFYFFSSVKALVKRHQRHWLCGFPVGSREAKQLCTTLTQVADRVHLPLGSQLAALSGAGGAWIVTNCRSDVRMDVSAPKALLQEASCQHLIDPPMSCLADMPQFLGVRNRTVLYQGSIELTSSWWWLFCYSVTETAWLVPSRGSLHGSWCSCALRMAIQWLDDAPKKLVPQNLL